MLSHTTRTINLLETDTIREKYKADKIKRMWAAIRTDREAPLTHLVTGLFTTYSAAEEWVESTGSPEAFIIAQFAQLVEDPDAQGCYILRPALPEETK